ncbi:MAG TPA: efflux transporter outer membrane subunit [Steroidobacteraceae bacterium]|nr:efflux transporter outer membrane subunit [Steroidobacteraceae bacterium]
MSFPVTASSFLRAPRTSLVLSACAALLAGCSFRMDPVDNPVKLPVTWDTKPAAIAPAPTEKNLPSDWWTNFDSPQLKQLVEEALTGNPTLQIAEERLRQAERALSVSRDNLMPDLSVNGSTSRTRSDGPGLPAATRESTTVSGQLRYDVDLWGGGAASLRASKATLASTRYDLDRSRLALSANVATQYFQLLSIRARVAIARDNLSVAERLLRIVDARYRNGVARQLDFTQQNVAVLQQRTNLIPLEAQERQTETALGLLLGRVPQEFHVDGETFERIAVPEVQPWLPSELLLRRPDLAVAEANLSAAHADIAVARANLLPGAISLTAGGGLASSQLLSLTDPTKTFSVSGVLSIAESIFSFRARKVQVDNARSSEAISLLNYASAIRTALKDVDDSLANAQTDLRREESQKATLEQAQRALSQAELQYREGSGDLQAVLDAQRTQFTAQDSLSQIRLARLNSALDLYVALGGGWTAPR